MFLLFETNKVEREINLKDLLISVHFCANIKMPTRHSVEMVGVYHGFTSLELAAEADLRISTTEMILRARKQMIPMEKWVDEKQRYPSNEACVLYQENWGQSEESAKENEKAASKVGKPRAYCVLEAKEFLEGWRVHCGKWSYK